MMLTSRCSRVPRVAPQTLRIDQLLRHGLTRSAERGIAVYLRLSTLRSALWSAARRHAGADLRPRAQRDLALLHAEPALAWTVEELAQRAAISRAGLAKRFVELVGETPMQYLTEWRMHLARRLLLERTLSLAEIAARVGYDSEATFNRAFRRVVGTPPAAWRQAKTAVRESIEALPDRKDMNGTEPARPNVNSLA